jgi:hypothetical protein
MPWNNNPWCVVMAILTPPFQTKFLHLGAYYATITFKMYVPVAELRMGVFSTSISLKSFYILTECELSHTWSQIWIWYGVIGHNFASRLAEINFPTIACFGEKIAEVNQTLLKCSYTKYLLFNFRYFSMNIHYDIAVMYFYSYVSLICSLSNSNFLCPILKFDIFVLAKKQSKFVWKVNNI